MRENAGKGWGPFTSRQLTTIVCVAIVAAVAIPTAAMAASGTFTSTDAFPAVTGTNSSTVANARAIQGSTPNTNAQPRWGVVGNAGGVNGVGVQGGGAKYGVFSNGNLGVAAGKTLTCNGCVGVDALSDAAGRTRAYAYVNADGTLDPARSRNIAIEKLTTGQYCVKVSFIDQPTFSVAPVVTVSDANFEPFPTAWTTTVTFDQSAMEDACTRGQTFLVALWKDVSGSFVPADSDFMIAVP